MPSTIINIQSGHSHGNYYHVDPTMPAVLRSSGGVNEVEWKSFCDQVNARLDTFNKARQFSIQITSALCGVAILACVGIVAVMITNDPYDPYTMNYGDTSASSGVENVALFFIIPAVLFVGASCVSCNTSNQSLEAYKDVHDICVEASKRNSNVSYHFRNTVAVQATAEGTHDRNIYIEVIFRDQMSVMQESPSNSYPTVSVAVLMTPEARLQQLEDMKHLLSAQEYDDKRSSILASV
jgi:hypothetical protein